MKQIKFRTATLLCLIALLILAACGGSDDGGEEPTTAPTSPPATEAPSAPEETEAMEPTEEEAAPTEAPAEPTEESEPEIPYDVPIMEGAQNLLVQETGTVSYVVGETTIEEVVEFYMTEMENQGWETVSASEIGLMATLVFRTEEARVSVSLQANEIAETVNVQLIILEL